MERIGHYTQLPDGWCYATIKEVFIINPKNKADDDVEVGFVPMANITDGYNNTFKYETKQWGKIKLVLLISQMETLQLRKYLLVWRIGNR